MLSCGGLRCSCRPEKPGFINSESMQRFENLGMLIFTRRCTHQLVQTHGQVNPRVCDNHHAPVWRIYPANGLKVQMRSLKVSPVPQRAFPAACKARTWWQAFKHAAETIVSNLVKEPKLQEVDDVDEKETGSKVGNERALGSRSIKAIVSE